VKGQNVGAPTLLEIPDLLAPIHSRHFTCDQTQLSRHRSMRLLTYNRPAPLSENNFTPLGTPQNRRSGPAPPASSPLRSRTLSTTPPSGQRCHTMASPTTRPLQPAGVPIPQLAGRKAPSHSPTPPFSHSVRAEPKDGSAIEPAASCQRSNVGLPRQAEISVDTDARRAYLSVVFIVHFVRRLLS
jgi:hypothetical protein